jgi:chorismate mutase
VESCDQLEEADLKIRGIRGAITVPENTPDAIFAGTQLLVNAIVAQNQFEVDDVASVVLTMTEDLNAIFPAKAVRAITGWKYVPLMCARELAVPGAMERCIRVLLHVNTEQAQASVNHVYLGEAVKLRPDMADDTD